MDISAFDLLLGEDHETNCILESWDEFEDLCNDTLYAESHLILLFTKLDILESKIKKVSFTKYFGDFSGREQNLEDVKSYLERLILSRNPGRPVTTIFTRVFSSDNTPAMPGPAQLLLNSILACCSES